MSVSLYTYQLDEVSMKLSRIAHIFNPVNNGYRLKYY